MAKAKKQNVGLYLRYRTPEGKQSPPRPVVWDSKKRLRPGWCTVAGVEEHHPECTYHLRLKVDGKWTWEAVGTDPHTAVTLRSERSIPQAEPIRIKSLHQTFAPEQDQPTPVSVPDKFRIDDEIKNVSVELREAGSENVQGLSLDAG
jgi:hypothetical protein